MEIDQELNKIDKFLIENLDIVANPHISTDSFDKLCLQAVNITQDQQLKQILLEKPNNPINKSAWAHSTFIDKLLTLDVSIYQINDSIKRVTISLEDAKRKVEDTFVNPQIGVTNKTIERIHETISNLVTQAKELEEKKFKVLEEVKSLYSN